MRRMCANPRKGLQCDRYLRIQPEERSQPKASRYSLERAVNDEDSRMQLQATGCLYLGLEFATEETPDFRWVKKTFQWQCAGGQ